MFVRDIAPELARDRDFEISRERPGQLIFGDGAAPGSDLTPTSKRARRSGRTWGPTMLLWGQRPVVLLMRNLIVVSDDLPALTATGLPD
jgi:hypothetical protein